MKEAARQEKATGSQLLPGKGSGVIPAISIDLLGKAHDSTKHHQSSRCPRS